MPKQKDYFKPLRKGGKQMQKGKGYKLAKQFQKKVKPNKLANSEKGKGLNSKLAKNAGK